jgi:hypothetical protein
VRVARHSVFALAALAFLNAASWSPFASAADPSADGEPQTHPVAGAPSLAPPEDVEGSWVGDDSVVEQPTSQPAVPLAIGAMPSNAMYAPPMYDEYAERAAYMYGGYPEEYSGIDLSGDPYAGYGGAPSDDGSCDGESCGECGHGRHCGRCGCCGGGPCGYLWDEVHSHRRFYVREEYLYWKGKGNPLPALVTTAPVGTPQEFAGVLGEPETTVLYGQNRANDDWRSGGRITAGMWLVDGEFLGVEGHYLGLEDDTDRFFAQGEFSQGGNGPILARPFTEVVQTDPLNPNSVTSTPASSLLAFPNFDDNGNIVDLDGQISVQSKVSTQSAGLLLRKLLWIEFTKNWRVDALGGYRYFRLNDGVTIHDFWTETGGPLGNAAFTSYDYFQARNEFHGGELGLAGSIFFGRFSLEAIGKLALGNLHQTVKIDGTSFVSVAGSQFVETGNYRLLTQPTNDGRYKRDVFAVIPETNLNLRFDLTRNVRLIAGYNFIYMSQAQRSGKAIDLNVNTSQIGGTLLGPAVPKFKFSNDNGYWLHGMNAGVEVRW